MPEKRVLIITSELVPFHYGGIGTQCKSLAAFFKRHGHRVSFLSRRPENYDEALFRSHYGDAPLFVVDAPPDQTWPPPHFAYAEEVARRFDEIYPEVRPDLVILADFNAEGLFLLLRSRSGSYTGTEFLLTINGMNHEVISVRERNMPRSSPSLKELPDIRLLLAMEDLCVHLAPWIVSPTNCAWEEIRRRLGIAKTARVIPNLVDLDLFRPEMPGGGDLQGPPIDVRSSADDRHSPVMAIKEGRYEPLILFVGRLDRMKGPDLLLKAYFEIAKQARQAQSAMPRITFIGRDCYWNEYGSTFLEYWQNRIPEKVAGAVSFLGQVSHDQIRDYIKRATVAVFPSRWEPFGIVCLEAMAMGCPVVVSEGTGLEEVLGPALSEFAVSVTEDTQPLVRRIVSLVSTNKRDVTPGLNSRYAALPEHLRERALAVVRRAEEGWFDILRDVGHKNQGEDFHMGPLCSSLYRLLDSMAGSRSGLALLKIYFLRQGDYNESDSLAVSYFRCRWGTLRILLPAGTGDRPLRLDPTEAPGTIRIREIVLKAEDGTEIWRADGSNFFRGCSPGGKDVWSRSNSGLVIESQGDDPQMLLDCPVTDRPAELHVTLCSTESSDVAALSSDSSI